MSDEGYNVVLDGDYTSWWNRQNGIADSTPAPAPVPVRATGSVGSFIASLLKTPDAGPWGTEGPGKIGGVDAALLGPSWTGAVDGNIDPRVGQSVITQGWQSIDQLKGFGFTGGDVSILDPTAQGEDKGRYITNPKFTQWLTDNSLTEKVFKNESGTQAALFQGDKQYGAARSIGSSSDDIFGGVVALLAIAATAGVATGAIGGGGAGVGVTAADSGVAVGGWTAPSYSLGGAGGSGLTATAGNGLTLAATTGTGSGLAAAAGEGLTLAAATGTGAGLAIGTGTSIIGSGIGTGLADLGLSASQVAAWSAPAASSSLGTATAADSIAKAAAPAVTSSSGSLLGDAAGVAGGIAKIVGPIAGLVDQLTGGGAAPGQPGSIAPGSAAASSRGLLLLIGGAGLVAYLATRK